VRALQAAETAAELVAHADPDAHRHAVVNADIYADVNPDIYADRDGNEDGPVHHAVKDRYPYRYPDPDEDRPHRHAVKERDSV